MDTGDLVQDAILKTMRNLERLDLPEHGGLLPYLRTAVRNLIRDQARNAARHGERVPIEVAILADAGPSPLDRAEASDSLDRYEAALERLRPDERQAILLRLELDCSWGLIAKELGKPSADAARVATSRALLRLAEEMTRER
jgi:RNA polymerase sigma-70 factor (ECF subfamily)